MKYQIVFAIAVFAFVCFTGIFGQGFDEQAKEESDAKLNNVNEERNKRAILAAAPVAYASPYASPYVSPYTAYASPYASYPYAYSYGSPLASPLVAAPYAKLAAAPGYPYAYYR